MEKIFICYSRRDAEWKNRLTAHLNSLQLEGAYSVWDDSRIQPGENWRAEIQKALNEAAAALLLISADFLNSDFIRNEEIPVILKRREEEGITVIPVILRPCAWDEIQWLKKFQSVCTNSQTLQHLEDKNQKAEYETILSGLAKRCAKILPSAPPPAPPAVIPSNPTPRAAADGTNPFTDVGIIRDPERFVERERELQKMISLLVTCRSSISITGKSKTGKSSMLYQLWHRCGLLSPGYFCFQIHTWEEIRAAIIKWCGLNENTPDNFREALLRFNGAIFIDEFDLAAEKGLTRDESQFIRGALQYNPGFRLAVASQETLKNIQELHGKGSEWFNLLKPEESKYFNNDEARLVLSHPWAPSALAFDEAAIREVLEEVPMLSPAASNGNGRIYHPFLLQRGAFHRFEQLSRREDNWRGALKHDRESML